MPALPLRVRGFAQWFGSSGNSILLAQVLVGFFLVVRVIAIFRFQHDIDESQNLHIVYGWMNGELPYRDRFDNHAPLFAWMFAPLAAWVGENANIVIFARLALWPIGLAVLFLIFRLVLEVANREIAWWTIALCLALADWSLKSVEFRPDVVWAGFWFLALWILLRRLRHLRTRDGFFLGLTLGFALLASIKTTLLVPALAVACLLAVVFCPSLRSQFSILRVAGFGSVVLFGFLIPPVLGFGALLAAGTELAQIRFCLLDVNQSTLDSIRIGFASGLFVLMVFLSVWIFRRQNDGIDRIGVLFATASTYLILLLAMAPELRKQTFLVIYPLLIFLALQFFWSIGMSRFLWRSLAALACLIAFAHFTIESKLWRDGMREQRALLAQVLKLTDENEYLLDGRGETIFVKRPVYLAFVAVTTDAVESGQLGAPNLANLVDFPTSVAIGNLDGLPRDYREYLKTNFLVSDDGQLRAAGVAIQPSWMDGHWIDEVSVMLPGKYVIVKRGKVVNHVNIKKAGRHTFNFGQDRTRGFLIWEEAWSDGFRPQQEG